MRSIWTDRSEPEATGPNAAQFDSDELAGDALGYDERVQRALADNLAKLQSGERQPISNRLIDWDPRTGVYTSRVTRRGRPRSRPRVVAVSRARRMGSVPHSTARSRESHRAPRRSAACGRSNRSRAPSGSIDGSEPGPADGPGARSREPRGALRISQAFPQRLGPSEFRAVVDRALGPDIPGACRWLIFRRLDDARRATFWAEIRREAEAERERADGQFWSSREAS
jgi:hypothetical protein